MNVPHCLPFLAVAAACVVSTPAARADEPPPPRPAATPPVAAAEAGAPERRSVVVPAVLSGAGIASIAVGVVLVATAPDLPTGCSGDTKTCARLPGQTPEQLADAQDRAGLAHAQPLAGWITVGLGAMLAAAGVLTFTFGDEERQARSRRADGARRQIAIAPFGGPTGGGLGAFGSF
jgi:hypothetical protein